jgi:hypothetical protein
LPAASLELSETDLEQIDTQFSTIDIQGALSPGTGGSDRSLREKIH